MLSQDPTTIRRHQRQQSTPQVFDPDSIISLQNSARRQHPSHHRGISLDVRQRRRSPPTEYQQATNTNQGLRHNQQHILRETQQQRLFRPGQQDQQQQQQRSIRQQASQPYLNLNHDEEILTSPFVQRGPTFDIGYQSNLYMAQGHQPYQRYSGPVNPIISADSDYHFEANGLPLYANSQFSAGIDSVSSQHDWNATVKPSRSRSSNRITENIAERVALYEGMAELPLSRPITPIIQNGIGYFPSTPQSGPFGTSGTSQPMPQRFAGNYDESLEETIKPTKSHGRTRNVFEDMREQVEANRPPSPPATAPLPSRAKFDSVVFPSSVKFPGSSSMKNEHMFQSYHSPAASAHDSRQSSPEISHSGFYDETFDDSTTAPARKFEPLPGSEPDTSDKQRRRSESVDSINLDEAMTDTGITIDDIAMYISSPSSDSAEQKWSCLFPGCAKKFGRKENIKSHVQTHLGDRQYQCPHCKKCFVRQHDLKRHAKIHSGIKPYPCACGNSFARHDALTRHRQRGMCIGAFDGIVKKTVKRGRPRKARPDDEDRLSKSSRTRSRVAASNTSSSEYSESNYGGSPSNDMDDVLDSQPFAEFNNDMQVQPDKNVADFQHQFIIPSTPIQNYAAVEDDLQSYISPAQIQGEFHLPIMSNYEQVHYRSNSIVSMPSSVTPYTSPSRSIYSPAQAIDSSSSPAPPCRSMQATPSYSVGLEQLSMNDGINDTELFLEQFGIGDETMIKFDSEAFGAQGLGMGVLENGLTMDMFESLGTGGQDVFSFGSP